MWKIEQIAYLAGIIDGEGTFYIGQEAKNCKSFNSRIVVVNTSKSLIDWIHFTFGGMVYSRTNTKNPNWKVKYEWVCKKSEILLLCDMILPYLVCKKKQAEIMIEFRKTFNVPRGRCNPVPENIHTTRLELLNKLRKFNHSSS